MSFDVELDSIDANECDAPPDTDPKEKPGKRRVQFYGAHACHNKTTEVILFNNKLQSEASVGSGW